MGGSEYPADSSIHSGLSQCGSRWSQSLQSGSGSGVVSMQRSGSGGSPNSLFVSPEMPSKTIAKCAISYFLERYILRLRVLATLPAPQVIRELKVSEG